MLSILVSMEHEETYHLSLKFSPPKIDLRQAQILDAYGDESYAQRVLNHKKPENVSREDFDYYGWVYPFMEPEDLLFYLYAMVVEFSKDKKIDCIDSFMYAVDKELPVLQKKLTHDDKAALKNAFKTIWSIGGNDDTDFAQCKNIQELIDISVEM